MDFRELGFPGRHGGAPAATRDLVETGESREGGQAAGRGGREGGCAARPLLRARPALRACPTRTLPGRRARAARGWARRSINVCVSGPRVCGEAGARGSPGTRCAAAPLWPPPARRARTHGLARTWPGGAAAVGAPGRAPPGFRGRPQTRLCVKETPTPTRQPRASRVPPRPGSDTPSLPPGSWVGCPARRPCLRKPSPPDTPYKGQGLFPPPPPKFVFLSLCVRFLKF